MGDPVDRDPVGPVGDRDQGGLARRQQQVASDHRAAGYGHHHVGTPPLAGPGPCHVHVDLGPPGDPPHGEVVHRNLVRVHTVDGPLHDRGIPGTQQGHEGVRIDVLGGEASPDHVVARCHDLEGHPSQVGVEDSGSHVHRLPRLQHTPAHHRNQQERRISRVPVRQPADDLGGLDLGCREIGTCDIGGPDPRCPGGGRPLAFEHPPGRIHEPIDVATTVGGPVSGQHGTHDVPPGLRLPIIQQGQDVVGHAEGRGNLAGLGDGPESAEGLETGDGTEQFGLGSRVGERPGGVATTDAGLLLAPVAVGGCHGIRVYLQGERPVGGEQLDQVWQVGHVGQVDPFRGPAIHHLGGPRPVGSEPELGLG